MGLMSRNVHRGPVKSIGKPTCPLVIGAGLMLSALLASAAGEPGKPAIGSVIPELHFKDIRYLPRSLKDLGDQQAFVLVFTNTTCPVAQRYWPKLKQLDEAYRRQGVQFVSVNVAPEDTISQMAQQAIDFGVEFPFVKDSDGAAAKALGVVRTPQVVVLDANRHLRYRGRVDDQQRLGERVPN